jgi:DNA-binding MurR/RpiR family transcriptional regulator
MSTSTVRAAIEVAYGRLSAQQRRAADFLLASSNYRTAFGLSVQEMASAAAVSEATLVRFSREIGYAGYHELRAALMSEAQQGLAPADRFALAERSREPAGTVVDVARQEVDNINRTIDDLDPRAFRRVVQRLQGAELVVTVGLGVSTVLARLAAYQLMQIGVRAEFLMRDMLTLVEQVAQLPRKTVVLVYCLPPYSKQTLAAAAGARERRLAVVGITDGLHSPLCEHTSAVLTVRCDNILFTNSLSSALVVTNALVTEIALADKSRALKQLEISQAAQTRAF